MSNKIKGWHMYETVGIGLTDLIECPIHGVVGVSGAMRDNNGKMLCHKCLDNFKKHQYNYIKNNNSKHMGK